ADVGCLELVSFSLTRNGFFLDVNKPLLDLLIGAGVGKLRAGLHYIGDSRLQDCQTGCVDIAQRFGPHFVNPRLQGGSFSFSASQDDIATGIAVVHVKKAFLQFNDPLSKLDQLFKARPDRVLHTAFLWRATLARPPREECDPQQAEAAGGSWLPPSH